MTREEKLAEFGEGPWLEEPDREEFRAQGLPCIIRRHKELGFLCGYVAVPPGHPLHGMDCQAAYALARLRAHGDAVTYAQPCADDICHVPRPGEPDDVWWFGFHCGYGWDCIPQHGPWLGREPRLEEYRDLAYVRSECEALALQLAAVRAP
jgi:hypothetical protein